MRVISGSARGTKLKSIEGLETRPTTDRVKESLFNMIQPYIYGSSCLDLYAGSGALGIELLSRGALTCVFVESSIESEACLLSNLEKTRLRSQSKILRKDVSAVLPQLTGEKFDFIMMDPPYFEGHIQKTLSAIANYDLLSSEGYLVIEHGLGDSDLLEIDTYYQVFKQKTYGKISILILRRRHEDSGVSREL